LVSGIDAGNLLTESKYIILAYKKTENNYIFHKKQSFTIGEIDPKIELDNEQNYTLIIVSTGTSVLANITDERDFNNVRFITENYANPDVKFLYQKVENFKPIGADNVINIKLKNSTSIKVIYDTSKMLAGDKGAKINQLTNAYIKYHKPKSIKLGNIVGLEHEETILAVKNYGFIDNSRMLYRLDFYNAFIVGNITMDVKIFIETLRVDELPEATKIDGLTLSVKPEYKHTYILKPVICGGYLGPNKTNFREFMCHNLGDGYSGIWADKFMGNMYSWGRKQVVFKQEDNDYERGNVWTEAENPCPSGFRVPTLPEWQNLLDERNNIKTELRGTGWKIGNRLALFTHNDFRRWLWSSSVKDGVTPEKVVDGKDWEVYSIEVSSDKIYTFGDLKHFGSAIRCIRKLPEEL